MSSYERLNPVSLASGEGELATKEEWGTTGRNVRGSGNVGDGVAN